MSKYLYNIKTMNLLFDAPFNSDSSVCATVVRHTKSAHMCSRFPWKSSTIRKRTFRQRQLRQRGGGQAAAAGQHPRPRRLPPRGQRLGGVGRQLSLGAHHEQRRHLVVACAAEVCPKHAVLWQIPLLYVESAMLNLLQQTLCIDGHA